MKRELPSIQIHGTTFLVEGNKSELREKNNEANIIRFEDMRYSGNEYSFEYDVREKNFPSLWSNNETVTVNIPELTVLDPVGLSQKYNLPLNEIKGKTDFEIMIDQNAYDKRVNKGILPTIEITGHTFYVDLQMNKLRPKDDFLSSGIVFSEIENYYDEDNRTYTIPYNPKTHEFQEPDYKTIKELPKDIIAVEFPSERILDRIGWNRKYGFEITNGLFNNNLKLQFAAKNVPWKKTFLVDLIEINLKAEKKQQKATAKQSIQPKQSKRKGRRM